MVAKSVMRAPPIMNAGSSVARMPSAPLVRVVRLMADSRRISATAMKPSTKYGPRRRKQMLPMIRATTITRAMPAHTPYHGAICLVCMSIMVV